MSYRSREQAKRVLSERESAWYSDFSVTVELPMEHSITVTAEDAGLTYTPVQNQAAALMEVQAGTSDAAIIDELMAIAMVGEGTSYADLAQSINLTEEEYGVGFRQGSDAAAALNDFFTASYADGTMTQIAETYGLENSIIPQ